MSDHAIKCDTPNGLVDTKIMIKGDQLDLVVRMHTCDGLLYEVLMGHDEICARCVKFRGPGGSELFKTVLGQKPSVDRRSEYHIRLTYELADTRFEIPLGKISNAHHEKRKRVETEAEMLAAYMRT